MVLNYIWIGFFLIAFVIALVRMVFWGDMEVFNPPTLFIFNTVLAIWSSLRFHMSFEWIFFSEEKKNVDRIFTQIAQNL